MKAAIGVLLLVCIAFCPDKVCSQSVDSTYLKKRTFIAQGTTLVNAGASVLGYDETNPGFHGINTVELSLGYYLIKRFALKAAVVGQNLDASGSNFSSITEPSQVNLLSVAGQARFDFFELPGFGSFFLQTGYGFKDLPKQFIKDLERWEILSLGMSLNSFIPRNCRFGLEFRSGFEKNNLSKVVTGVVHFGINYYPICESCNRKKLL